MTLHIASANGYTEIVRLFLDLQLEKGVIPATNDNRARRNASCRGYIEIVRLLLKLPLVRGVEPAEALRLASKNGHTEIYELLQEHVKTPEQLF